MIEPLRRRHRWMVAAVAVVVVPLFFAALSARPDRPYEENLDGRFEEATREMAPDRTVVLETEPPMTIAVGSGGKTVTVEAPDAVELPGLVLYWQPSGATFPEGAALLGAVRGHGRTAFVPDEAVMEPGLFVLYSLGHGGEIARVELPRGGTP